MSFKSAKANIFLVSVSTAIIIFAIVIIAQVQDAPEKTFSQVITVGPVWNANSWSCTSDADYMVHGVLVSYGNTTSVLQISIAGKGTQPDLRFTPFEMRSFSIGGPADSTMSIGVNRGTITGFLTLQTMSDATASCTPL